jgi:two-component system OmpR family sensor kinase
MKRSTSFIRALWFRIALVTFAVLIVTLGVVVFAVNQLTLVSERTELDDTLEREGEAIVGEIVADVAELQRDGTDSSIDASELEVIVSRSLARHPGSAVHLSVVRFGELVLSSARGPSLLIELRDDGMLPNVSPGRVESIGGVRIRSAEIVLGDTPIAVETLGDDEAVTDEARTLALRTLGASAFGAVVGLVALSIVVHRSTRGLNGVSATVHATRLEDLSIRVPDPGGKSEVAQLARDVNAMLDDLASARSAKDELIASVSHELRTPLAAARGHTDLLREQRAVDPAQTIARIDRELNRMTRLVEDLLALSRAGDPSWLSRRLVNVREIVDELSGRLPALSDETVAIAPIPDVLIEVDADRVLQALSNLVVNALIHTPAGTPVLLSVETYENRLVFVVRDEGPGVPGDVLASFGQAFVRGSAEGSGLGLAVTRAVARAHGGDLGVESSTDGTTVRLSFPLDASPR